jgi:hypothetical protein
MLYVLTPAVTAKLHYDCDGLSYFQEAAFTLYSSSVKLSLLFTSILHLARPFDPGKSRGLCELARAPRTGEGRSHSVIITQLRTS